MLLSTKPKPLNTRRRLERKWQKMVLPGLSLQ